MNQKKISLVCLLLVMAVAFSGCTSSEEKLRKFLTKGDGFYQQGEYVKAALEYRNAITIDPNRVDALFKAGQSFFKQGKMQEAYAFYMKVVEKQPDHVEANLQLGKLLLGAKELAKANERVEVVLKKEPGNTQALLLRGGILLADRKPKEARAVLAGRGGEVDLYLLLSAAYTQSGDLGGVETVLNKGIAAHPQSVPLLVTLANLYLNQQKTAKVEEVLKRIIALEPGKPEHVERYASWLWHVGRRGEVDPLLQGLLAKDSGSEDRWVSVAAFYLSRQAVDKGQQVLDDGLQRFAKSFRLRLLLKDASLARGEVSKAMAALQECLKLDENDPGWIVAQRSLAELALRTGDLALAEASVAAVLKKSANDVEGHQLKASYLVLKGELDQAIAEYRTVLQARPRDNQVSLKLADALVRNRQNSLAMDTLKQGLQLSPDALELHRALARVYLLDNKKKEAEEQLRKAAELRPGDLTAQAALVDLYGATDNQAKAMQACKAIIAKVPDNPLGYIKLSSLYAAAKQGNEAVAALTSGLAAVPDNPLLLEHAVRLFLQLDRAGEALALTEKRLRSHPDDLLALTLQAESHAVKKDYEAAEKDLRKAMELNNTVPELGGRLARVLALAGKADGAIRETEQAVAATGGSLGQWVLLAELYKQAKQPDQVPAVYDRALMQHPDSWYLLNNSAYGLVDKVGASAQDLGKAEGLVKRAQLLAPGNPAVMDTAGWLAYKQGNLVQAQVLLTMALMSNPNNPVFNHHLAMVMVQNGKKEEAKVLFEKVVRAPGDFSERDEAGRMLKN